MAMDEKTTKPAATVWSRLWESRLLAGIAGALVIAFGGFMIERSEVRSRTSELLSKREAAAQIRLSEHRSLGGLLVGCQAIQELSILPIETGGSQQIWPPVEGSAQRLLSPPGRYLGVIPGP